MQPINLSTRREMFNDRYLIETLNGASLYLHEPIPRETVHQIKKPVENSTAGCYNLVQENGKILLYYRGYSPPSPADNPQKFEDQQTGNLLISEDGVNFKRPELGLVDVEGSTLNNVLFRGRQGHNFCVFIDENPAAAPEQRFKAVGGEGQNLLHGFCSPDGIHWEPFHQGPLKVNGMFDSVNVPFWDNYSKCSRLFSRCFVNGDGSSPYSGFRAIQSCTSEDFVRWTSPDPHRYDDGIPLDHLYTNATMPCPGAEHILLSFPMRFVPERTVENLKPYMEYPGDGISDAVFLTSRDGVHWDRTFMEAWVRPGVEERNWTHRNQTPAVGLFTTGPKEWSMYLSEHYGWDTCGLRRVTIRPHGFSSIRTGYKGGELVTKSLNFSGSTLFLNYSTSAVGSISVEIQDMDGHSLDGFNLGDMAPMFGDELDAPVLWKSSTNLSQLNGKPIRIKFQLKDADLYSLRFGDS